MIAYDFHIHSCLSPCSDDDMTIYNICNMAHIKGLDWIAICDHNSVDQLPNLHKAKLSYPLHLIYGVEIQSIEDVHVLGLFQDINHAMSLQHFLHTNRLNITNIPSLYGNQWILDENDQYFKQEQNLLLLPIQKTLKEICEQIHQNHGIVILAHAINRKFGIFTQLGLIPDNLIYDGIEISCPQEIDQIKKIQPNINTIYLTNSDAHHLQDIQEREQFLDEEVLNTLWRKYI